MELQKRLPSEKYPVTDKVLHSMAQLAVKFGNHLKNHYPAYLFGSLLIINVILPLVVFLSQDTLMSVYRLYPVFPPSL